MTRFLTSATILSSTSIATTFELASSNLTVMLPVPGPISSIVSVLWIPNNKYVETKPKNIIFDH